MGSAVDACCVRFLLVNACVCACVRACVEIVNSFDGVSSCVLRGLRIGADEC